MKKRKPIRLTTAVFFGAASGALGFMDKSGPGVAAKALAFVAGGFEGARVGFHVWSRSRERLRK